MKILILCDHGNNRSVVLASRLKYYGGEPYHDVLTAGIETNSEDTLLMLQRWADLIILTEGDQEQALTHPYMFKCQLWNIGPDKYPRPHNKELLAIVSQLIADHPELKERR